MTVSAGMRLGPYELLESLGAGGMGEVYRARDTRLQRDVAVKVLPAEFSSDGARLDRFEREARSASALNHPNIVTIHEVGQSDSTSFIVMELVDGKNLRQMLNAGPLPLRKLFGIASQVADGLAKAHAAGIVHRDLKPENVMVTRDGFAKILDFGLAKLTHTDSHKGQTEQMLTLGRTEPHLVMGTAGYMSPEQAMGQRVDFRSDQFSFGALLYEMTTGKAAFDRPTTPEKLAAIIREEPEPIAALNPRVPAQLRWTVERCLAKDPKDRYAATEDLARDLATLRDHVSDLSSGAGLPVGAPPPRPRWERIALAVLLLAGFAGFYLVGRRVERSRTSPPRFQQLTFRGAGISSARFAPDGQTVVYAAQWEGKPSELFAARLDSPETRQLGLSRAEILSISSTGQMALLIAPRLAELFRPPHSDLNVNPARLIGVLAEVPLAGGAPRELLENVAFADWSPDGKSLAVARGGAGKQRIEFPVGHVIFEANVLLPRIAISPSGDRLAFVHFWKLYVTEPGSGVRDLQERALEVAWHRGTNEIWFNTVTGGTTELFAVVPGRVKRLVTALPGDFVLHDISADGRVLLGRISESSEIVGDFAGDPRPRNLSHLDRSVIAALSPDGETVLFNEMGQSGPGGIYLRRTDGSPPKRLADGYAWALSPDGKFVLAAGRPSPQIFLIPTGPGQPRLINTPGVRREGGRMGFFPDGRRIWFLAEDPEHRRRVFVQDIEGGKPRAVTPHGVGGVFLSPDGHFLCAGDVDRNWYLYSTETSETRKVVGLLEGEYPTQWTGDGKLLYVRGAQGLRPGETAMTTRVYRLDPRTGGRELWKEIPPVNPSAGGLIGEILISADGKRTAYSHYRYTSDLFVVEGLR
jgi:dipeptidyl aminopeptidase/acylaminoacyl peptidase